MSGWDDKRSNTSIVVVRVIDIDDLPPAFSEPSYTLNITENELIFPSVGIEAKDQDTFDAKIHYSIVGKMK